jgi:hypothetical protein
VTAEDQLERNGTAVYTGFSPRWIALLGYVLAVILLLGSGYMTWSFVVFPIWVLLVSSNILVDNLRRPEDALRR